MENVQSVSLPASRERLARALSKFERLARDAAETISALRLEKSGLEKRLADLTKLVEQERSNFEQRTELLASAKSESEERAKIAEDLSCRLDDQERLMNEQIQTISRLEEDLENSTHRLRESLELEKAWRAELEEWQSRVANLESRLSTTQAERDSMKSQLYEKERLEAQYAIHLSPEERDSAAKAIDTLLDQLSVIGTRVAQEESK